MFAFKYLMETKIKMHKRLLAISNKFLIRVCNEREVERAETNRIEHEWAVERKRQQKSARDSRRRDSKRAQETTEDSESQNDRTRLKKKTMNEPHFTSKSE